jgi:hypothetical protein
VFSDIFLNFVGHFISKNLQNKQDMNTITDIKVHNLTRAILFLICLVGSLPTIAQQPTRGIGIYPGAPEEYFGPQLTASSQLRNVARGRMACQSSSFDFNMTAQLLTDGIIEKAGTVPVRLEVTTPEGQLPQRQRESTIDGNDWTRSIVMGEDTWLQYAWHGMTVRAEAIHLIGTVAYREGEATEGYCIRIMASADGRRWQEVARDESTQLLGKRSWGMVHSDPNKNDGNDNMLPTRRVDMQLPFGKAVTFSRLRVELKMKGAAYWTFTENPITLAGRQVENLLPSSGFTSAWMTLSDRDEWASIDLGAPAEISNIRLHWLEKPQRFELQLSDDGATWRKAPASFRKGSNGKARYVRVFIPSAGKVQRAVLSEVEVMGRGGLVAQPHAEAGWQDGKFLLDGGDWRLQRASQVSARGAQISSPGFDASQWMVATVPATVLMSYVNAGALPNPNYDDNLLVSSESFFNSNFWYRREFRVPGEMQGQRVFLCFDGINWKADVWLNGQKVDRIEGAFMRGKTDVTRYLRDGVNVLAVQIEKCAHPGAAKLKNEHTTDYNGGLLGADNPTFHATVGWDWISSIRGRDIGIWDDVYLTATPNSLTLSDPLVGSRVAINGTDTLVTMTPAVIVKNHADSQQSALLAGWIGDIRFEKEITLAAGEEKEISFSPADFPQLREQRMHLWWPNGYGDPYLYDAGFTLSTLNRAEGASNPLSTAPKAPLNRAEGASQPFSTAPKAHLNSQLSAIMLASARSPMPTLSPACRCTSTACASLRWAATGVFLKTTSATAIASTTLPCAITAICTSIASATGWARLATASSTRPATATASWCGRTSGWPILPTAPTLMTTRCSCAMLATWCSACASTPASCSTAAATRAIRPRLSMTPSASWSASSPRRAPKAPLNLSQPRRRRLSTAPKAPLNPSQPRRRRLSPLNSTSPPLPTTA